MEKEIQTKLTKKSNTSYKMVLNSYIKRKIEYICRKIWETEWSGVLFYKPEGSFEKNNLVIRCEDLLLLDIGSAVFTEFITSPEIAAYLANHQELLDCQMGLIHSHNLMSTFFSGTDLSTLLDEGKDRNHFVSLIVNNQGSYTAAITRKVNITNNIDSNVTYKTFGNSDIKSNYKYNESKEEMEYFTLNILEDNETESFKDDINEKISKINKDKEANKTKNTFNFKNTNLYGVSNTNLYDGIDDSFEDDYDYNPKTHSFINDKKFNTKDNIDNNKQLSLFDNETINYDKIKISKDVIKSLTLQLLTGSIVLSNTSSLDTTKWCNKMESIFEKRFGKYKKGHDNFEYWAANYVDSICLYCNRDNIPELDNYDDEYVAAILAFNLRKELNKLPANKYITYFISLLDTYIL